MPRWTATLGLVGVACLLIAGVLVVSTVEVGAGIYFQLAGFIAWLVFIVTASICLVRQRG